MQSGIRIEVNLITGKLFPRSRADKWHRRKRIRPGALDRVITIYRKPVYRFIRLKFHKNNEDAKDLTQGFFATALERDFFTRFDPEKASFRTYLQTRSWPANVVFPRLL
jgi:hypothetical protein